MLCGPFSEWGLSKSAFQMLLLWVVLGIKHWDVLTMHFFLFYNLSNPCHNTLEGIRRAGIGRAELYLHLDIALVASSLLYLIFLKFWVWYVTCHHLWKCYYVNFSALISCPEGLCVQCIHRWYEPKSHKSLQVNTRKKAVIATIWKMQVITELTSTYRRKCRC